MPKTNRITSRVFADLAKTQSFDGAVVLVMGFFKNLPWASKMILPLRSFQKIIK